MAGFHDKRLRWTTASGTLVRCLPETALPGVRVRRFGQSVWPIDLASRLSEAQNVYPPGRPLRRPGGKALRQKDAREERRYDARNAGDAITRVATTASFWPAVVAVDGHRVDHHQT